MNDLKSQFLLDPSITFLNFGSFGACPKPIFEEYQNRQLELERGPVQFMAVNGPIYLKQSREALANYIHCDADDLVFVSNPSYAMNIVAKSFGLKPGDEILTTNLEYGACDKTWMYYCTQAGALYKRQPITLPLESKEKFISEFFSGLSKKTKAIFIGQITSTTALIFPVKEIVALAKQNNLITIVDGAHVPGHIPLNIKELDPDIYTGACHKWMLTPKGCSFLYVCKEMQAQFDPLVVSWGYQSATPSSSRFLDYHQMQGTRDFSAFLTLPKAIAFMKEYEWDKVSKNCRDLVRKNATRFSELLNTTALAPVSEEFFGQMQSLPIQSKAPEQLQRTLFENYRIEIPVMRQEEKVFIRYSINAFNSQNDLDKLYVAIRELKERKQI